MSNSGGLRCGEAVSRLGRGRIDCMIQAMGSTAKAMVQPANPRMNQSAPMRSETDMPRRKARVSARHVPESNVPMSSSDQ